MRVSVVVPVYNPGRYIGDLIESLRTQTLDPAEFEVLFVDDGSTDATPALLDAAAEATPNFRVIHTPNSGWPGRPRNIGLDAARGDYVFLSDHDDRLDPEALQRLTDFALEHASDVVIGRIVGVNRNAPDRIFARTLVDAQEDPGLLMTSLTPQKLYRRAFLDERGIRFPEGKRRLEDHLFVTTAYLRAQRVSIYADHPIYYFVLRDDGRNASRSGVEWAGYFANAAESIAVVDAEAPDEATRVVMRARWLRVEAISRLRGARFLGRPDGPELLAAVRDLLQQHYRVEEVDRLPVAERLIGRLLLDGRDEDVVALAEWEATADLRLTVEGARIEPERRRLVARIRAEADAAKSLPPAFEDLPEGYPSRPALLGIRGLPRRASMTLRFRRTDGAVVDARVEQTVADGVLTATATFDLDRTPRIEEGRWRLRATVRGLGRPVTVAPSVARTGGAGIDHRAVRLGDRRMQLTVGSQRRLMLRIERTGLLQTARRTAARAFRAARRARGVVLRRVRRG